MARLLLILMLVWQPLGLQAVAQQATQISMATAIDRCKPVEMVDCCQVVATEEVCPMTGGVCRCGMAPVQPESPPPALPVTNPTEWTLAPISLASGFVVVSLRNNRVTQRVDHGRSSRSHNTSQAFLGVWLT